MTTFFPDISLIFSKMPDISLTAVKFPDISRFSRQVVTHTDNVPNNNRMSQWTDEKGRHTWSLLRYGDDPSPPAMLMPSASPDGLSTLSTISSYISESVLYVPVWFCTTLAACWWVKGRGMDGSATEAVADGNSRVCSEVPPSSLSSLWNTSSTL